MGTGVLLGVAAGSDTNIGVEFAAVAGIAGGRGLAVKVGHRDDGRTIEVEHLVAEGLAKGPHKEMAKELP